MINVRRSTNPELHGHCSCVLGRSPGTGVSRQDCRNFVCTCSKQEVRALHSVVVMRLGGKQAQGEATRNALCANVPLLYIETVTAGSSSLLPVFVIE